jgi:hypothetical protein
MMEQQWRDALTSTMVEEERWTHDYMIARTSIVYATLKYLMKQVQQAHKYIVSSAHHTYNTPSSPSPRFITHLPILPTGTSPAPHAYLPPQAAHPPAQTATWSSPEAQRFTPVINDPHHHSVRHCLPKSPVDAARSIHIVPSAGAWWQRLPAPCDTQSITMAVMASAKEGRGGRGVVVWVPPPVSVVLLQVGADVILGVWPDKALSSSKAAQVGWGSCWAFMGGLVARWCGGCSREGWGRWHVIQ